MMFSSLKTCPKYFTFRKACAAAAPGRLLWTGCTWVSVVASALASWVSTVPVGLFYSRIRALV